MKGAYVVLRVELLVLAVLLMWHLAASISWKKRGAACPYKDDESSTTRLVHQVIQV